MFRAFPMPGHDLAYSHNRSVCLQLGWFSSASDDFPSYRLELLYLLSSHPVNSYETEIRVLNLGKKFLAIYVEFMC